jgi:hypothetical protein
MKKGKNNEVENVSNQVILGLLKCVFECVIILKT